MPQYVELEQPVGAGVLLSQESEEERTRPADRGHAPETFSVGGNSEARSVGQSLQLLTR